MPPSPLGPGHTPHIARLDVLRAMAFLGVYMVHMLGPFPFFKLTWNGNLLNYSKWPAELYPLLPIAFGWLGVPLFFVLSGFCIHYSTLRRKAPLQTGDFYWRRFLRIYPAYFACVVVCSILSPWLPEKYFDAWQVISHILMIHNFTKYTFVGLNGSLWSLGVEFQFYLLYPLLILALRRRMNWGQCLAISLVFNACLQIVFSLTSEPYAMNHTRATWSFPLVTWCDWILGAALAEAYVERKPLFPRVNLWLIGSAIMLLISLNIRVLNVQAFLFASVFFTVVMQRYLFTTAPLRWIERCLVPIGIISYSLYLWHGPVMMLVEVWGSKHHAYSTLFGQGFYIATVTSLFLFPLAWLSYRVFEVAAPAALRALVEKRKALASVPVGKPEILEREG
jgi:peptidoglycan/LPS O-acetylase OafA/YrhL